MDLGKRFSLRLPGKKVEPITLWGNPVLRTVTEPVTVFDASIRKLVDQLFETMYAIDNGVGLAANQIGRTQRVFVFDCHDDVVGYVINPVVEPLGDEMQDGEEGCLSLPGFGLDTVRHLRCRVTGQDIHGDPVSYDGEGLRARCFQHELGHLDGGLYIDCHDDELRADIEAEMRTASWFGHDSLDPESKAYRAARIPPADRRYPG